MADYEENNKVLIAELESALLHSRTCQNAMIRIGKERDEFLKKIMEWRHRAMKIEMTGGHICEGTQLAQAIYDYAEDREKKKWTNTLSKE